MAFKGPYTKLYCHLVWGTWDRVPIIRPEDEPRLHGMMRAKLAEIGCTPIASGGVEDHVHVLCQFAPTICVAEIVKRVKGASSHFMSDDIRGPEGFRWQVTYGALTIGERALANVKAYVLNQRDHHAGGRVHDEWERVWIPDDGCGWPVREGGLDHD